MTLEIKILLGFHDQEVLALFGKKLERKEGISVKKTDSLNEMLEEVQKERYDSYFMDVNLGDSNGEDINPARQVYDLVRERVEKEDAKFIASSHNYIPLDKADEEEIPAMDKYAFSNYLDKL